MGFANPIAKGDILKVYLDQSHPSPEIPLTLGKVVLSNQFANNRENKPFSYVNVLREEEDDRFSRFIEEYNNKRERKHLKRIN